MKALRPRPTSTHLRKLRTRVHLSSSLIVFTMASTIVRKNTMHAHFDCFSGAAGDMMLAACLDAADSLPYPLVSQQLGQSPTADGGHTGTNSDELLSRLVNDLEGGLPELKGEFELSAKRVWRGMGKIAAMKVDVRSVYNHEAAPVPGAPKVHETQPHEQGHHHHEHEHSSAVAKGSKEDPQHICDEHSHSHDHSHDHEHSRSHDHSHNHSHDHSHSRAHSHDHQSSGGKLRNLPQITKMLQSAPSCHIPSRVASIAIEAFTALAHAEMRTHGAESIDQVHFHEVGAVDSIVDTVGTLLALHYLGVNLGDDYDDAASVTCSPLPLGEGTVWTDHGLLPVPAFAAMRLMIGMPTCPGPKGVTGELVTPTAAALLRVLAGVSSGCDGKDREPYGQPTGVPGRPPSMIPRAVGIGAGSKDFERHPNVLRLILGDIMEQTQCGSGAFDVAGVAGEGSESNNNVRKTPVLQSNPQERAITIDSEQMSQLWDMHTLTHMQANIDDATPELLAHAVNLLLDNGAIDVWVHPIVMKKGRSANSLNCICRCDSGSTIDEEKILSIIFRHTTTLGIRIQRNILRAALNRRFVEIQLPYTDNVRDGKVNVKISSLNDGEIVSVKAEFEECKLVSEESGVPLKIVSSTAERLAWDLHITP